MDERSALGALSRLIAEWEKMRNAIQKASIRRMRKRIVRYVERTRKNGDGDSFRRIPLMSWGDRIWLLLLAGGLAVIPFLGKSPWWGYLIWLPFALFFGWKGVVGIYLDLPEGLIDATGQLKSDAVDNEVLVEKISEIAMTRQVSLTIVEMIVWAALIVLEILAVLLAVFAALFGALGGA